MSANPDPNGYSPTLPATTPLPTFTEVAPAPALAHTGMVGAPVLYVTVALLVLGALLVYGWYRHRTRTNERGTQ